MSNPDTPTLSVNVDSSHDGDSASQIPEDSRLSTDTASTNISSPASDGRSKVQARLAFYKKGNPRRKTSIKQQPSPYLVNLRRILSTTSQDQGSGMGRLSRRIVMALPVAREAPNFRLWTVRLDGDDSDLSEMDDFLPCDPEHAASLVAICIISDTEEDMGHSKSSKLETLLTRIKERSSSILTIEANSYVIRHLFGATTIEDKTNQTTSWDNLCHIIIRASLGTRRDDGLQLEGVSFADVPALHNFSMDVCGRFTGSEAMVPFSRLTYLRLTVRSFSDTPIEEYISILSQCKELVICALQFYRYIPDSQNLAERHLLPELRTLHVDSKDGELGPLMSAFLCPKLETLEINFDGALNHLTEGGGESIFDMIHSSGCTLKTFRLEGEYIIKQAWIPNVLSVRLANYRRSPLLERLLVRVDREKVVKDGDEPT